jgi:hypothetical protein
MEKGGGQTGGGGRGLPDVMGGSARRGFVGAGRDGRVSEREGHRGPQGRVFEQKGRVKLAA